jgi:hypothetical protein
LNSVVKTPSKRQALGLRGLTVCICLVAAALLGGAVNSAASSATHCNTPDPTGRQFCVAVEDSDGVSPSGLVGSGNKQVNVQAYQFYKLSIANVGGSTLTQVEMDVVLKDNVSTGGSVNSNAVYVPSASAAFCSVVSTNPNKVRCTLPNLPSNTTTPTFVLGYRTSTTPNVTSTDATVSVSTKEGGNQGANPADLSFTENTSLEPNPEGSVAWSPAQQGVTMGTSPTFDSQFSTMQYTVPAGKKAFVSTLNESVGNVCAPTLTQCVGELVTTDLSGAEAGTFTQSNLFHLAMTMSLDLVKDIAPGGNTKDVKVSHRLDSGAFEVLSTRCGSTPPASTETPCVNITADKKAKLLFVDVWHFQNGGWMTGG